MRRSFVLICAVTLAMVCSVPLALGATAQAQTRLQANKAIARRDAKSQLEELRLPHGAVHVATQPPLPALAPPRTYSRNAVAVNAWWTSHASPDAVLAYVKAHPPAARGYYELSYSDSSVTFVWTIDGAHLYSQQLQVTVATLASGQTGIMAQAQSVWMVPRPLSERVPVGVRAVAVRLRIGSGPGGLKHQRTHDYLIRHATTVAAIVRAFNAMPISQPGLAYSCPGIFAGMPRLTLRFLSAGGGTLARAQVNVYPGASGGSGWTGCDPIAFWIGARSQTSLTSHTFVKMVAKLIGANVS